MHPWQLFPADPRPLVSIAVIISECGNPIYEQFLELTPLSPVDILANRCSWLSSAIVPDVS